MFKEKRFEKPLQIQLDSKVEFTSDLKQALTDAEIAEQRISELKVMLSNSDYKAIKFA